MTNVNDIRAVLMTPFNSAECPLRADLCPFAGDLRRQMPCPNLPSAPESLFLRQKASDSVDYDKCNIAPAASDPAHEASSR